MAIIGIDIGSQSLKAVVVEEDGRPIGQAATSYGVDYPRPGWAQQDPLQWEDALAPTIGRALADASVDPGRVDGIGVSGQLDGCIAVDSSGMARGPCLIWMDRRAESELPSLDAADFRTKTGLVLDAGHMAAKIRWLKRNAMGLEGSRFHQPVSYLVERLTGRSVFDHGLASTTMLYDLHARDYDDALLSAFGIERQELPAIANAVDRAGALSKTGAALTGLPAGITVAVGTGDDFATPLGAGLTTPGRVAVVLGTAEVVGALAETAVLDDKGLVETHGYVNDLFFVENPGWLSGGAMAWLRELVRFADYAELEREAATVAPGCEELTLIPALSGAMAPEWIASARGCLYGLTPAHSRAHIARALLEGCAFAMRDVVDRLREIGVATDSLLLVGGGARGRVWAQMRADIVGLPADIASAVDTCPLGAAMLAAVACGAVDDIAAAAVATATSHHRVEPDAAQSEAYQRAYLRYRQLFDALRPMY